jgi:hypothetical protein
VVEVVELYVDGEVADGPLEAAVADATEAVSRLSDLFTASGLAPANDAACCAAGAAHAAGTDNVQCLLMACLAASRPVSRELGTEAGVRAEAGAISQQVALARDIFGNPFRPPAVNPAWLTWDGGTIVNHARVIYKDHAFDRLPALGKALEKAGCADVAFLDHCHQPGEHVRGCWVLGAVTGKV